jgi:hypothetical protein
VREPCHTLPWRSVQRYDVRHEKSSLFD